MAAPREGRYPPIDTLKAIADDVWIVDGPIIEFGVPWPRMPFPTRMTVIRHGGDLFLHSPTRLVPGLSAELLELGTPRWIIGPNRIHYWWIPEWHAAFPEADVHLAPKIAETAKRPFDFPTRPLDQASGYPWDDVIDTLPVEGSFMTEVVFFHGPSATLVLTDLIENFELHKLDSWLFRALARAGGVVEPDGQMPRDMRWTFRKKKPELRAAIETMIAWNPARIVVAHGRWYETGGADELRRAFRWLLEP
jgi:hypothetical protein